MIRVNKTEYKTIADAASIFGVSTKTVNLWIKKRIISVPPTVEYGAGIMRVFPVEYIQRAKKELDAYRRRNRSGAA